MTTSFYQNPVGSNLGSGINPTFISIDPALEYDSWLTIGSESTNDEPVSSVGMSDAFAEFRSGNGFVLNSPQAEAGTQRHLEQPARGAGDDGRVLLAQLTVTDDESGEPGDISGLWNMQWRQGGTSTVEDREMCSRPARICHRLMAARMKRLATGRWPPTTTVRACKTTSAAFAEVTALPSACDCAGKWSRSRL